MHLVSSTKQQLSVVAAVVTGLLLFVLAGQLSGVMLIKQVGQDQLQLQVVQSQGQSASCSLLLVATGDDLCQGAAGVTRSARQLLCDHQTRKTR